ncbi:MAG: chorismate mutase [Myxococcota bacterium]|nr:chorismate mutase [Myxococcota bacterium]
MSSWSPSDTARAPDSERQQLDLLRAELEHVDASILDAFVERLRLAEEIGSLKVKLNLPLYDSAQASKRQDLLCSAGSAAGVETECIRTLYQALHSAALRRQKSALTVALDGSQRREERKDER